MVDDFSNFLDHICLCYVGCGVLHWNTRLAVGVGGWFDLISPLFLFRFVTIVFSQYIYADHLHCIFHYRLYNFLLCRLGQTKVLFILNCINFFEVSKKTKKKNKTKKRFFFDPYSMVDLLSIMPVFAMLFLSESLTAVKFIRAFRKLTAF